MGKQKTSANLSSSAMVSSISEYLSRRTSSDSKVVAMTRPTCPKAFVMTRCNSTIEKNMNLVKW